MSDGTLALVKSPTAAEICKKVELAEAARALLAPQLTPRQYLDALIAQQLWEDACLFLAHGLPRREAIWWAFQCAKQVKAEPPHATALQAVEKWLLTPNEEHRKAAEAAAEPAGALGTAPGAAAKAVAWTGGSLTPPDQIPVPPPETGPNLTAAIAVLMAGVTIDPAQSEIKFAEFLKLGVEVANGANRWPEPPPAPAAAPPRAAAAPARRLR